MHVDFSERRQGSRHAMKFIFEPRAFMLKLFYNGLNQSCFCHAGILPP